MSDLVANSWGASPSYRFLNLCLGIFGGVLVSSRIQPVVLNNLTRAQGPCHQNDTSQSLTNICCQACKMSGRARSTMDRYWERQTRTIFTTSLPGHCPPSHISASRSTPEEPEWPEVGALHSILYGFVVHLS